MDRQIGSDLPASVIAIVPAGSIVLRGTFGTCSGTAAHKRSDRLFPTNLGSPQAKARRFWRFDLGISEDYDAPSERSAKGARGLRRLVVEIQAATSMLNQTCWSLDYYLGPVALGPALWKGLARFQPGRQEHI